LKHATRAFSKTFAGNLSLAFQAGQPDDFWEKVAQNLAQFIFM
jgi:hypothetical protein